MIQIHRVSLAVIAASLFGSTLVEAAPTISPGGHPRDKHGNTVTILDVHENCAVELTVEATGTGPLTYQWKRGATTLTAANVGARDVAELDGPTLKLIPSYLTDVGEYKCTITDSTGSVTTNGIKVAAVDIRQKGVLAADGQTLTLTVSSAPAAGLLFRWYRYSDQNGTVLNKKLVVADRPKFTGEATKALKITGITPDQVGQYFCRVYYNGVSMDSGYQSLAVVPTPASTSLAIGETLTLPVFPQGAAGFDGGLSYQWNANGSPIAAPAGTANPLVLPNIQSVNAGAYTCTVSGVFRGAAVPSTTTAAAQVFVVDNTAGYVLGTAGKSASMTFSPTGTSATHTYQWYKKEGATETPLVNSAKYAGVSTATLTVNTLEVADAVDYFCEVTAYGQPDRAGVRRLIVIPAPASTTVTAGNTAELTVEPAGAEDVMGDLTYQWKAGVSSLSGQTAQTLSIPNSTADNDGAYTCVVTLPGFGSATSPAGTIVIVDSVASRKLGLQGAAVELAATASTAAGQTFQWYRDVPSGTDILLPVSAKYLGANTKKLKITGLTTADAGDYYCKVTTFGVSADSGMRRVVVAPHPPSRTVLSGSPLQLQVVPEGAPLSDFSFVWKYGTSTLAETSSTFAKTAVLTDAGTYTCTVTLTGVGSVTTKSVVVVVDSTPFTRLALTGKDASLLASFKGMGSTFQWYRVVDGFPDVPLSEGADYTGVQKKELKIKAAAVDDAGSYRCVVTTFGESVQTSVATLVLLPAPESKLAALNTAVSLQLLPVGATPAMSGLMTFQWKKTAPLPGETASTLTFDPVQTSDAASYVCITTLPGAVPSTLTSLPAKLNVVNTIVTTKLVLQGTSPSFETPVAGLGQTYQWYKLTETGELDGTALIDGPKYVGATTKALKVVGATLDEAGAYFCRVTAYGMPIDGGVHRLVVVTPPPPTQLAKGEDLTLEVLSAGTTDTLTYQWSKGTQVLAGKTGPVLEIPNVQTSHFGDYSCLVTLAGVTPVKAATKVSVVDITNAVVLAIDGRDAKLTVTTAGAGQTFTWYRTGDVNPLTDGPDYAGATGKALTIKGVTVADAGEYRCDVKGFNNSAMVAMAYTQLQVITSPSSTFVAAGTELELQAPSTGAVVGLNYQWKRGTALVGTNSATLTIPAAALTDAGDYVCVVSYSGALAATTNKAAVAVAQLAPNPVFVKQGATATLPVLTKGNITFLWSKFDGGNRTPLSGAKYTGVTAASLKVANCQFPADSGDYVCDMTAHGVSLSTLPVTLNIYRAPDLTITSLPTGIVGGSYSHFVEVDADPLRVPKAYAATSLPAGLVINKTTGQITGKPTAAVVNQNVTITATNDIGTDTAIVPITVNALPSHLGGDFTGLFGRNAGLNAGLGGYLQMTVASSGVATGKVYLGVKNYAFTGALEVDSTNAATATATASISVTRTGLPALTMTFQLGTNDLLTSGVLTDGTNSLNFTGWRNKFSGGSATAYAGLHNFGFGLPTGDANVSNNAVPQGVGFGSFTVAANGTLTYAFTTADGVAGSTFATFIGPNGEIALYKTLYSATNSGSIAAQLDIDDKSNADSSDNSLSGTGTWSRPADGSATQRTYKAGFAPVNLAFEGGRYTPPALVLGVTAGTNNANVNFEHGGLPARLNPNVNVSIQVGSVTPGSPNLTSLAFSATDSAPETMRSTGYFKGTFTLKDNDPTTPGFEPEEVTRTCTFLGVIYPKNGALTGAGYVLVPQLPSNGPPATTLSNSPILSAGAFFEPGPLN